MILSRGANAANIYWQVGSSATLWTTTVFKGIILADQSISLATDATLDGRASARIGAVTLNANIVTLTVPVTLPTPSSFGPIRRAPDGSVTLVIANTPGLALALQTSANLSYTMGGLIHVLLVIALSWCWPTSFPRAGGCDRLE